MTTRRHGVEPLPIDAVLPELIDAVRVRRAAVLRAPTGAGKTTRVAPALLDAGSFAGTVVLVEPRRVAARAAARRIAAERGTELGAEVGYHVRFDRKAGAKTRILAMTEGMLIRRLQDDPFLDGVGAVVFDEVHERNLDGDLALAMVRKSRADVRADLVVVAMSATIDPAPLAAYLDDCPVVESEGRLHPVELRHVTVAREEPLEHAVTRAVRDVLADTPGDLLVFLPGVGEIRRVRAALSTLAGDRGIDVVDLYGDLPAERQDEALRSRERRRIVLATNVAESSVTVEGVTAVVDSGLARQLRFDPAVGLDRLEVTRIARAAADQRAGRAGRIAPGICVRLWSAHEDRALRDVEEPEIRRVDLSRAVLELRVWGETSARDFPWLEAPDAAALDRAEDLLVMLGAIDGAGVTEIGRAMARLPLPVRVARMLVEGARLGATERVALAAAVLSERDPFRSRGGPHTRARRSEPGGATFTSGGCEHAQPATESDLLDRVAILESFDAHANASAWPELDPRTARVVLKARDQLLRLHGRGAADGRVSGAGGGSDESVLRAILAAFPDRVARRRERTSARALMVGGRGVRLADESGVATAELFVCVDVDASRRGMRAESLVRQASAVERDWLSAAAITERTETYFDPERESVVTVVRTRYRDLLLDERSVAGDDDAEATRVLADAASRDLSRALSLDGSELGSLRARVDLLAEAMPELSLPRMDDARLRALLPELCAGRRSFAELRKLPLAEILRARLGHEHATALERHAPERLEVPSGSRVRLVYEPERPPVLAARIQELFGLAETPRVAAGRVRVLVHLLAPNGRPQQVTDDLASFWNTTYAEVRKELRRRYPKHAWPEDPWNAPPERRPKRRS